MSNIGAVRKERLQGRIAELGREEAQLDRATEGLNRLAQGIDDEMIRLFEGAKPARPSPLPIPLPQRSSGQGVSTPVDSRSSFSPAPQAPTPSLDGLLQNPQQKNASPQAPAEPKPSANIPSPSVPPAASAKPDRIPPAPPKAGPVPLPAKQPEVQPAKADGSWKNTFEALQSLKSDLKDFFTAKEEPKAP